VYNHNLEKRTSAETARILAASANVGNGIVHLILVIYIFLFDDQASDDPYSAYWQREHELGVGGIAGPLFFTVANLVIGRNELRNNQGHIKTISLLWNTFIAISGVAIPFVWRRFLEEGLGGWPYPVIFLWYLIFFMESVGVVAVWFHYFMAKHQTNKDDDEPTKEGRLVGEFFTTNRDGINFLRRLVR